MGWGSELDDLRKRAEFISARGLIYPTHGGYYIFMRAGMS